MVIGRVAKGESDFERRIPQVSVASVSGCCCKCPSHCLDWTASSEYIEPPHNTNGYPTDTQSGVAVVRCQGCLCKDKWLLTNMKGIVAASASLPLFIHRCQGLYRGKHLINKALVHNDKGREKHGGGMPQQQAPLKTTGAPKERAMLGRGRARQLRLPCRP